MKRKRPSARKTFGYARVSTDKQADNGISIEAQEDKIRGMAKLQEWPLAEVVTDPGASAATLKRPGMTRLLEAVRRGEVERIIIAKLDRITRSVRDLADLLALFEKCEVSLVSVAETLDTGTAVGKLVINVMASVSQWEREAAGERTRDAMRALKARGLIAGNAPYGYRSQGRGMPLVEVPGEQVVLTRIREMRAEGASLKTIADTLSHELFTTRRGTPWRPQYVANVLKGERDAKN